MRNDSQHKLHRVRTSMGAIGVQDAASKCNLRKGTPCTVFMQLYKLPLLAASCTPIAPMLVLTLCELRCRSFLPAASTNTVYALTFGVKLSWITCFRDFHFRSGWVTANPLLTWSKFSQDVSENSESLTLRKLKRIRYSTCTCGPEPLQLALVVYFYHQLGQILDLHKWPWTSAT